MSGLRATDPIVERVNRVQEENTISLLGIDVAVKNAALAMAFTIITGGAGIVWTASELYSRLMAVEEKVTEIPDLGPVNEQIAVMQEMLTNLNMGQLDIRIERIETRIQDQNLSGLQSALTELQINLQNIMKSQEDLRGYAERTVEYQQAVEKVRQDMQRFKQDMDDVWTALDELTY